MKPHPWLRSIATLLAALAAAASLAACERRQPMPQAPGGDLSTPAPGMPPASAASQ